MLVFNNKPTLGACQKIEKSAKNVLRALTLLVLFLFVYTPNALAIREVTDGSSSGGGSDEPLVYYHCGTSLLPDGHQDGYIRLKDCGDTFSTDSTCDDEGDVFTAILEDGIRVAFSIVLLKREEPTSLHQICNVSTLLKDAPGGKYYISDLFTPQGRRGPRCTLLIKKGQTIYQSVTAYQSGISDPIGDASCKFAFVE